MKGATELLFYGYYDTDFAFVQTTYVMTFGSRRFTAEKEFTAETLSARSI